MLYDDYRARMGRVADFLATIRRFRILIIAVCAFAVALTVSLLAVRGIVYESAPCPKSITVGEELGYRAGAVFTRVKYEYAPVYSEQWSEDMPRRPGEYKVRSVARGGFGNKRYGAVYAFEIQPKRIEITFSKEAVTYGDKPVLSAELAYSDTLHCSRFEYEDLTAGRTAAVARAEFITVSDENGKDVTSSYKFGDAEGEVRFTVREINLSVPDKSKVYDGLEFKSEEYVLDEHTPLADGDGIVAQFTAALTDAGTVENRPEIRILHGDGQDVSANYKINISAGALTVEKRPLAVETHSGAKVYDGREFSYPYYSFTDGKLVAGHAVALTYRVSERDAGVYENRMELRVLDTGRDVTHNYELNFTYGKLTISKRPVTVSTASNVWTYDGAEHFDDRFDIFGGTPLADGHSAQVFERAGITDAGERVNALMLAFYTEDGEDVTRNYDTEYLRGRLTVKKRPVGALTGDCEFGFDGEEHSYGGVTAVSGSLAEGHRFDTSGLAVISEPWEKKNSMQVRILAADGGDATGNYELTVEYGTLTMTPRPITVAAGSAQKIYDGTPLVSDKVYVTSYLVLAAGHRITARTEGSRTDAGIGANKIVGGTLKITDGEGADKTFCYVIEAEAEGSLIVTPRPVQITAASAEKVYDGSPLTADGYGITEGAMASGQSLVVRVFGERTDAGESPNEIAECRAFEGSREVTFNYEFSLLSGTLRVIARAITVTTEGAELYYDGAEQCFDGFTLGGEYSLVAGHFAECAEEYRVTDAGVYDNRLSVAVYDAQRRNVTHNYDIAYVYGKIIISPRPITLTAGSAKKVYDGTPLVCKEVAVTSDLTPALVGGHELYAETADSRTDAGVSENRIDRESVKITDSSGAEVGRNYDITYVDGTLTVTKRPLKVTTVSDSWVYDGEEHSAPVAYLSGLVAGHYVDWSEGKAATITDVGIVENVCELSVNDGERDVTHNYEISYEYGTLEVTPREITISAESQSKEYDGTPLPVLPYKTQATSEYSPALVKGHRIEGGVFAGSITNVGEAAFYVSDCKIYDGERDVSGNYLINYGEGKLVITPRALTVRAGSALKVYDGSPLTDELFSYDNLLGGHTITAETYGSRTEAGEGVNSIVEGSVIIKDARGAEVTHNYEITLADGTLTVTPRTITVSTVSDDKVYDGTPLVADGYEIYSIHKPALVEGHKEKVVCTGSRTDAGESLNTFDITIADSDGRDVTRNYNVVNDCGFLKVNKRPLMFWTQQDSWVYDGDAHSNGKHGLVKGRLVEGHVTVATDLTEITDVGRKMNEITVKVYDADKTDVTGNYNISYQNSIIFVTPRPITVAADVAEKIYDGAPAECGVRIAQGSLAKDTHSVSAESDVTVTDAGIYKLAVKEGSARVYDGERDITANYEISYDFARAVVTVLQRPVKITSASATKYYDGTPLTARDYTVTVADGYDFADEGPYAPFAPSHRAVVTVMGSQTVVGKSANTITRVRFVGSSGQPDLTHNYKITVAEGELTVIKCNIYVYARNARKAYDGTPLTCDEFGYTFIGDDVYEFDWLEVTARTEGSQTDVGEGVNRIVEGSVKVTYDGEDVTENFDVVLLEGRLIVTAGGIIISTPTAHWYYDGKEHSEERFSVLFLDGYELAEGHYIKAENFASITEVGQVENSATFRVFDAQGQEVTDNYLLEFEFGTLHVSPYSGGGEGSGGGSLDESGSLGGTGSNGDGSKSALEVMSTYSGSMYVRLRSYGNYLGRGWLASEEYAGSISYGGESYGMNYLTGIALANSGRSAERAYINVKSENYLLPYYMGLGNAGYVVQSSDVKYIGDTSYIYAVDYIPYDYIAEGAVYGRLGNYYTQEAAYSQFVYGNYLTVPTATAQYLNALIAEQGFAATDPEIVAKVADYIKGAAKYNLDYNKAIDESSDAVVSFLRDYKEGVCRHYASAATLMYRALGLPARYVIGYSLETVKGEWVNVTADRAHAWVEVYIKGFGWVTVEVTGSGGDDGNGGNEMPSHITLKPADEIKEYDGTPLVATRLEDNLYINELERAGYSYEVEFGGSQIVIGESASTIERFIMFNPDGEEVTDIEFELSEGKLTVVNETVITVITYGLKKTYDGTATKFAPDEYYCPDLPAGYSIELEGLEDVGLTEAGVLTARDFENVKVIVRDAAGRDVSRFFRAAFDYEFEISRREITVTSTSETKPYDGKPLENAGYRISGGSLAEGHTAQVTVTGSIKDVGVVANTISEVRIYDAAGRDVTRNYYVTCVFGTLTIEHEK